MLMSQHCFETYKQRLTFTQLSICCVFHFIMVSFLTYLIIFTPDKIPLILQLSLT